MTATPNNHIDVAALVGLIDGCLSPADVAVARTHIATCLPCRESLNRLSADSNLLTKALLQTDFPVPPSLCGSRAVVVENSPPKHSWLVAAAIITLVVVGVSPLGALISDTIRSVIGKTASDAPAIPVTVAPEPEPAASEAESESAISFRPATSRVTVNVLGASYVFLRPASGIGVRASASSDGVEFVVAGDRLNVIVGNENPVDLTIWLPLSTEGLSLLADGAQVADVGTGELDEMRIMGVLEIPVQ